MTRRLPPAALWTAGALLFFLLATANSGGYRYGASDQAFYIPAVRKAMDASLFPRDSAMLAAQGGVILWDGLVAGVAGATHLPLPWVFFVLYSAGIIALYGGAALAARAAGAGTWATIAFLAALTLRHRIAKTGVNTLEGYLHPRMIAFALGLLSTGALLKRRPAWAMTALLAAAVVHPTTAVWFGMLLGVAAFAAWPRWRAPLAAVAIAGGVASIWAIGWGPLAHRAVVMDAAWLAAIEEKDYLFPHEWPFYAWVLNLLPAAIAAAVLVRARNLTPELRGLLWGSLALTAFFLATLPFVAMRYALAVQMQIPRVFWMVEVVALLALARLVGPAHATVFAGGRAASVTLARAVATFLVAVSVVRGGAVLFGDKDGRLVSIDLARTDWTDALSWLRQNTPVDAHVLADPDHAWLYGSSVRIGAERDLFHEDVKDAALAMYDRSVAMRVVERRGATLDFSSRPEDDLMTLARRYSLDYLLTDERLDLPVAYENATFRVYELNVPASARRKP